METINLTVKLAAYTKGIIPDVTSYIKDVPNDGQSYVRVYREWKVFKPIDITVDSDSGLSIIDIDEQTKKLKLNQWTGKEEDLDILVANTTYYIIDNIADTFIDGGTSFSDEQEDYLINISGGTVSTSTYDIQLLPLDSKGE